MIDQRQSFVGVHRDPEGRSAFTLIELMITIVIIGILAGLVLGALNSATTVSNTAKTQSTISRINSILMTKWESYRIRRVPIDSRSIFTTIQYTMATGAPSPYPSLTNTIQQIYQARASQGMGNAANSYADPVGMPPLTPTNSPNVKYPTTAQVAILRMLAMRELQRYELPSDWNDVSAFSGNPPYQPITPTYLRAVPQLAMAYLNKLNQAAAAPGVTQQQILDNGPAECLYLIVTMGAEDNSMGAQLIDERHVGDVDGDGLLEFQDAWPASNKSYPTSAASNNPIMWIRWPAGFHTDYQNGFFASELDKDPRYRLIDPDLPPVMSNLTQDPMGFSADNHDPFDPLKLDLPYSAAPFNSNPRGYVMVPLIYSAGADGQWGLDISATLGSIDPWAIDQNTGHQKGTPIDPLNPTAIDFHACGDNITNHVLDTR